MKQAIVIIGMSAGEPDGFRRLDGVENDVADVHGFFKYRAGYDIVEIVRDRAESVVTDVINRVLEQLDPGDRLVIYFAGHGHEVGHSHVWVCAGARRSMLKFFKDVIQVDHVRAMTDGRGLYRSVVSDCCFDDPYTDSSLRGGGATLSDAAANHLRTIGATPVTAPAGGVAGSFALINACDKGQTAVELGRTRRGLFTASWLDVLTAAADGRMRVETDLALSNKIADRMRAIGKQNGVDEVPRPLYIGSGDPPVLLEGAALETDRGRRGPGTSVGAGLIDRHPHVETEVTAPEEAGEADPPLEARPGTGAAPMLPPVPPDIVALQKETARLANEIGQIERGVHPDVRDHYRILARLKTSVGEPVTTALRQAVDADPSKSPSELCKLAPVAPIGAMLGLIGAVKRRIEKQRELAVMNVRLRAGHEADFKLVVRSCLGPFNSPHFPTDRWGRIVSEVTARRYSFASNDHGLLEAAEREYELIRSERDRSVNATEGETRVRRTAILWALIGAAIWAAVGIGLASRVGLAGSPFPSTWTVRFFSPEDSVLLYRIECAASLPGLLLSVVALVGLLVFFAWSLAPDGYYKFRDAIISGINSVQLQSSETDDTLRVVVDLLVVACASLVAFSGFIGAAAISAVPVAAFERDFSSRVQAIALAGLSTALTGLAAGAAAGYLWQDRAERRREAEGRKMPRRVWICGFAATAGILAVLILKPVRGSVPFDQGAVPSKSQPGVRDVRVLWGHTGAVRSVAFSADGRSVASGGDDYAVILWDIANGRPDHKLEGKFSSPGSVAFSRDGKSVMSADASGITLWDAVAGGSQTHSMTRHDSHHLDCSAFSPDGKILAGGCSTDVQRWDTATGENRRTITPPDYGIVTAVAFSPDGKVFASCNGGGKIALWNTADWTLMAGFKGQLINSRCLAFSSDGNTRNFYTVVFSPDGLTLASGGDDKTVKLWNVRDIVQRP